MVMVESIDIAFTRQLGKKLRRDGAEQPVMQPNYWKEKEIIRRKKGYYCDGTWLLMTFMDTIKEP